MDDKFKIILLGAALVVLSGLFSFIEKLLKKGSTPVERKALENEKIIGLFAFVVAVVGAWLSFQTSTTSLNESKSDKRISDSTRQANDSLTLKLIGTQDSLLKVQSLLLRKQDTTRQVSNIQLNTALEALKTERIVLSGNNQLLKQQIELGEVQQKAYNEITGGNNFPILRVEFRTSPYSIQKDFQEYVLILRLDNRGDYILQSVKGYTSIRALEKSKYGDGLFTVIDTSISGNASVKKHTYVLESPFKIFDIGTLTSGFARPIYFSKVKVADQEDIIAVDGNIQWSRGTMQYYFQLLWKNGKPVMQRSSISLNDIEVKNISKYIDFSYEYHWLP